MHESVPLWQNLCTTSRRNRLGVTTTMMDINGRRFRVPAGVVARAMTTWTSGWKGQVISVTLTGQPWGVR